MDCISSLGSLCFYNYVVMSMVFALEAFLFSLHLTLKLKVNHAMAWVNLNQQSAEAEY